MSEQMKAILLLLFLAFLAGGCVELFWLDNYTVTHTTETVDYDYQTTSTYDANTQIDTDWTYTSDDDTNVDGRVWCFAIAGDCVIRGGNDEQ